MIGILWSVSFTLLICSLILDMGTKVDRSVNEYTRRNPSPSRMYRSLTALNTSWWGGGGWKTNASVRIHSPLPLMKREDLRSMYSNRVCKQEDMDDLLQLTSFGTDFITQLMAGTSSSCFHHVLVTFNPTTNRNGPA